MVFEAKRYGLDQGLQWIKSISLDTFALLMQFTPVNFIAAKKRRFVKVTRKKGGIGQRGITHAS